MRRVIRISLYMVVLCTLGGIEAAEVYKWKDTHQVTTYSQLPPAHGVPAVRMRTSDSDARAIARSSANTAAAGAQANGAAAGNSAAGNGTAGNGAAPAETPAQQKMRQQLDAQEKARLAQLAQERQNQCERARAQFDQLTQHARMRVQQADGSVRMMPEAERQSLLKEAKARIVEFCSG